MSSTAEPTSKRRKLDNDSPPHRATVVSWENTVTQDNARAHFGDSHTQNINGPVYITSEPAPAAAEDESKAAEVLKESLEFEQMDARLETISKAHAKTCQWLFGREEYKTWRDPTAMAKHHGFLWIKGKPGAGKSTLMKCAKQYGENNNDGLVISFFFNARGTELERSVEGMYRSLIYQLLERKPELSSAMAQFKKRKTQQVWSSEALRNMFEAAIRELSSTQITCYVDALDECDDEQAREMVESFESFGKSAFEANIHFRVLLSSRHYPHIAINKCIEMALEGQEGHEADLADYVRCKLKIGKSKLAMEIRDAIRVRASGVFLWVVLVIRILNDCDSRGETHLLRERLAAIPDGLSKLFEEILRKRTEDLENTLLTYQWILFASRPLERAELYFAVRINSAADDIKDWDPEEITVDVMDRFLLNSSKGMAQLTRGKHPTVQFIHESVKDYLLETGLKHLEPSLAEDPIRLSHDALWRCCDHYLRKSKAALLPENTDGLKKYMSKRHQDVSALRKRVAATHPFLSYATDGVLYHANFAHPPTHTPDEFVATFPLELWHRLFNLTRQYHTRRLLSTPLLAYVCVLMKAHNLAIAEIQKDPSCATRLFTDEYYPSLLGAATANDDHEVMELLLEFGADPYGNATSTSESDCLAHAIVEKNALSVQILLGSGADFRQNFTPRPRMHSGLSYLELASVDDVRDVIEVILSHEPYRGPTCWPKELTRTFQRVRSHRNSILKQRLLTRLDLIHTDLATLDNGSVPGHYVNAFVAACCDGNVRLITSFMSCDISSFNHLVPEAMFETVYQNQAGALHALIDHGVDADLPLGPPEMTALVLATELGEFETVRLLIQSGADINHRPDSGQTALHSAIHNGNCDMVEVLLELGADPNIVVDNPKFFAGNALHSAARWGQSDIIRMLFQHPDVVIDALNPNGEHAVEIATIHAHDKCVQVLLERSIPIKYIDKALQANTHFPEPFNRDGEREEIHRMLIAKGASQMSNRI